MEKKQTENRLSLELNLKFQMRDYKLRFASTKGWLLAIILILMRVGIIRENAVEI